MVGVPLLEKLPSPLPWANFTKFWVRPAGKHRRRTAASAEPRGPAVVERTLLGSAGPQHLCCGLPRVGWLPRRCGTGGDTPSSAPACQGKWWKTGSPAPPVRPWEEEEEVTPALEDPCDTPGLSGLCQEPLQSLWPGLSAPLERWSSAHLRLSPVLAPGVCAGEIQSCRKSILASDIWVLPPDAVQWQGPPEGYIICPVTTCQGDLGPVLFLCLLTLFCLRRKVIC